MADMHVYIDLLDSAAHPDDWPHNEFGEWMPRTEIEEAIRLGLNSIASIMPEFNWRFVEKQPAEGLIVRIRGGGTSFSSMPPWYRKTTRTIEIGAGNISFRRLDFANSSMRYRYEVSITDPAFDPLKDDWSTRTNYHYFGTLLGPHWGNKDMAAYVMHEFYHLITGNHLNMDNNNTVSPKPTAQWRSRFCSRETDPPSTLHGQGPLSWPIVLVKLRTGNILNDNSIKSPSICISSCPSGWNLRSMTDIDADRLATGRCSSAIHYSANLSGTISVDISDVAAARQVTGTATRFTSELRVGNIIYVNYEYICVASIQDDTHLLLAGPSFRNLSNSTYTIVTNASYTARNGYVPVNIDQTVPKSNPHQGYTVSYPKIRDGWRIKMQQRNTKRVTYLDNWHDAQSLMEWSTTGDPSPVDADWFVVAVLDKKE
ncbi:MAG: hypothetical protein JXA18_01175 [Chitinispirillaceae bacterium]|nr:hypothetical protein [Chitinispirillaceae bacterium]